MSLNLTTKQRREYDECFCLYDRDRDGYISPMDLGTALRSLGQYWTQSEIVQLTKEAGSKLISKQDFFEIARRKANIKPDYSSIEAAFQIFDKSGNGKVSVKELRHVLTTLGECITNDEFSEVMKILNVPQDGEIDYRDFITLLKSQ